MNHKKTKYIFISIILISVFGLIIGFFVDWKFPTWIYFSGSSTIQPLIQKISKIYYNSEIIADAGGSSTGMSNVLEKKKDIGMLSKIPPVDTIGLPPINQGIKTEQQPPDYEKWSNLKIKTITIAYDGIGIIYKLNDGNINKNNIDITKDNIKVLYEVFQGNNKKKLSSLMPNSTIDKEIIPFARTGGAELSGTAEAFLVNSNLVSKKEIPKDIYDSLKAGKYGPYTQTTSESNLQTWQAIKDFKLKPNEMSMTYLSAGFIKNNLNEIQESGFQVALYNGKELINLETNEFNVGTGYQWYRPFNLLVRLSDIKQDIKNFINWYIKESLIPNSKLANEIKEAGYIILKQDEYQTMCLNNNDFYKSDFEILSNSAQRTEREKNKIYYGAYNPIVAH